MQTPIHPATRLEDLPQEMPTLNRADQVWRVTSPDAEPYLVLSEFQTRWDAGKKLDMALYALWLKKKHRLRVVPTILLCLPNHLIWKRTELMNVLAESPIYQQIQEEGRRKGQEAGLQKGRQEGLIQAVKLGLELRFGGEGMDLFPEVEQCSDLVILAGAREAIREGRTLEEIKRLFQ
jgi:hypothetical protein